MLDECLPLFREYVMLCTFWQDHHGLQSGTTGAERQRAGLHNGLVCLQCRQGINSNILSFNYGQLKNRPQPRQCSHSPRGRYQQQWTVQPSESSGQFPVLELEM
jgi:hypothetical protein